MRLQTKTGLVAAVVLYDGMMCVLSSSAAAMTALAITACIIWCVCSAKSNRQKDGFHRLRQHRDDYEDEIRLTSMGSKKSLLSHEFQDESESDEDTLYANKLWHSTTQQCSHLTTTRHRSLRESQSSRECSTHRPVRKDCHEIHPRMHFTGLLRSVDCFTC